MRPVTANGVTRRVAGMLLLVLALALSACGDAEKDEAQLMQDATAYVKAGDLRAAAIEFRNLLQQNPQHGEARYQLGKIYFRSTDFPSAEKEYRRAIEAGWDTAETRVALAEVLLIQGKFKQLLETVSPGDRDSPVEKADLLALRAAAVASLGDREKADALLAQAADLAATAFQVLRSRFVLAATAGDLDAAGTALDRALEVWPDSQEFLLRKAQLLVRNGDAESAETGYRRVLELEPRGVITWQGREARLGLGRLLAARGLFAEAQTLVEQLLKRNDGDIDANYVGGLVSFRQGDYELARARLQQVLAQAPDNLPAQLLYGAVSYSRGDYEQSAHYLTKYVAAVPGNEAATRLLARTRMMLGQHAKARALLESAAGKAPDDAQLLGLIGASLFSSGERQSGIEKLERAVSIAPDDGLLREQLAKAYLLTGNTEQAIGELQALVEQGGDRDRNESLMVLAYVRGKAFDKAKQTALGILERRPEDPAVLTLVANVYSASGDYAQARDYLARVLDGNPGYLQASMALARVEKLDGNPGKARKIYLDSAERFPDAVAPLVALAGLAEQAGDMKEMAKWLERGYQRHPDQLSLRLALVELYIREKDFGKAESLLNELSPPDREKPGVMLKRARIMLAQRRYQQVLELVPRLRAAGVQDAVSNRIAGMALIGKRSWAEASEVLKQALADKPDGRLVVYLARALNSSGRPGEAVEILENWLRAHPDDGGGWKTLGLINQGMGRNDEALDAYEQALKADAGDRTALNNTAWLYALRNDPRALQFAERAYRVDPDDPGVMDTYGWLLVKQDRNPGKGRALLEKALARLPDVPEVQYHHAVALYKTGRKAEAREALARLLASDRPFVGREEAQRLVESN